MERIGEESDLKLVNSREWYEEHHQAHWEERPR